ncbi:BMA-RFS-1 [Dirofilaria immitis]|nr:BMA-RFS-1 [Dirofilaria immitis]
MDTDDPKYDEETGLNLFLRLGAPWLMQRTGCPDIDTYLNGGIARGKLTEFIGNVASGKTQLCLSLIANQLIDDEEQQSKVVYIDTNGSFRSSRLLQMLRSRGVQDENTMEKMLRRVLIARTYDENDLRAVLSNIQNHFCSMYFFAISETATERSRDDVAWRHLPSGKRRFVLTVTVLDVTLDDCMEDLEKDFPEGVDAC